MGIVLLLNSPIIVAFFLWRFTAGRLEFQTVLKINIYSIYQYVRLNGNSQNSRFGISIAVGSNPILSSIFKSSVAWFFCFRTKFSPPFHLVNFGTSSFNFYTVNCNLFKTTESAHKSWDNLNNIRFKNIT